MNTLVTVTVHDAVLYLPLLCNVLMEGLYVKQLGVELGVGVGDCHSF